MDPAVRVAVAAVNEGRPEIAAELLNDSLVSVIETGSGSVTTPNGHVLEHSNDGGQPPLTVDGHPVTAEDLELDELVQCVARLAPGIEYDGLALLIDAATSEVERTRLRLLLEDILFDATAEPIATDRIRRLVAREHHRARDVSRLFDC